ncbi:MAG: aminopeptidase P N-terminal domain-containing protein [Candidatus Marinimicrobia bacterium]|nr:aminopeptidase P N-terminal domain-containing protein [Candidatus Neomarinimicrobiota bacterium]
MTKLIFSLIFLLLPVSHAIGQYNPYPDKSLFAEKREIYMDKIGDDAVAIIASHGVYVRNDDQDHDYRQDSKLFYLTGFEEPRSIAVLRPGAEKHKFILFVRKRDKLKETWNGKRYGVKGAMEVFNADTAYAIDDFEAMLPSLLKGHKTVYHNYGADEEFSEMVADQFTALARRTDAVMKDAEYILGEMRKVKSKREIELLQKAVDITVEAHREAMMSTQPGMSEYEIEAVIEYVFRKNGSQRVSYNSIVGSGANATILHYNTNEMKMNKGDLLLLDAAAEWGYYSADVTRTYPVSGKFSKEQAAIYKIVYDAQQAGMKMSKPGNTRQDISDAVENSVIDGLINVGLLTGSREKIREDKSHKKFYLHGFGHWIGLDVHDAGAYTVDGESVVMEQGMVFTIEPGVYINEDESVDPKWWNIGVRIEDCILITKKGNINMSRGVPRKIKDIEKLMKKKGLAQKD